MTETRNDTPIGEVRKLRGQISARFDHDPVQLVAYYVKLQAQYRDRLIDSAIAPERKDHSAA